MSDIMTDNLKSLLIILDKEILYQFSNYFKASTFNFAWFKPSDTLFLKD